MATLRNLVETWEMICGRMDKYGESILGSNEEATRYALIDPILYALGWEIDNPKYVRVECSQEYGGKPDYTLMRKNKPVIYVEAKRWGTISSIKRLPDPLSSDKFVQLHDYCFNNSVSTGAFSDGGAWYIFDYSNKYPKQTAFVDADKYTKADIKKLLYIRR